MTFYGIAYDVDLETCRVRMLQRVAEFHEDSDRAGIELVCYAAGVDRATLRRFLEGKKITVNSFVAIITRGLCLDVQAVAARMESLEGSPATKAAEPTRAGEL
jgi:hypothetical protein